MAESMGSHTVNLDHNGRTFQYVERMGGRVVKREDIPAEHCTSAESVELFAWSASSAYGASYITCS